jgi:hypothetical protein
VRSLPNRWLLQVASSSRDAASRILESDLEQIALILTTLVASTTYGWVEGFAIETPRYQATQIWWVLGHFSTYSVAMALLFACITGGFGLLKARSMFTKGKRYFLFTFAGNFPFSWLVEDFAFFWFSPEWRLTSDRWTNWFLGGVWILDPWRTGVKIWIPNWYWPVLVFWLGMMWYAHRCTVYDNIVKDEIAREIVPHKIEIPHVEAKMPGPSQTPEETADGRKSSTEEQPQTPDAEPESVEPRPSLQKFSQEPSTPRPEQLPTKHPTLETQTPMRSPEAEEALAKLRAKWLRNDADNASNAS